MPSPPSLSTRRAPSSAPTPKRSSPSPSPASAASSSASRTALRGLAPPRQVLHLTIEADVEGYTVPIDVNQQSAEIEVRPDRTIITYAHIAFTVRQIMFSPSRRTRRHRSRRPLRIRLPPPHRLHPALHSRTAWMWPERNEGVPAPNGSRPTPRTILGRASPAAFMCFIPTTPTSPPPSPSPARGPASWRPTRSGPRSIPSS